MSFAQLPVELQEAVCFAASSPQSYGALMQTNRLLYTRLNTPTSWRKYLLHWFDGDVADCLKYLMRRVDSSKSREVLDAFLAGPTALIPFQTLSEREILYVAFAEIGYELPQMDSSKFAPVLDDYRVKLLRKVYSQRNSAAFEKLLNGAIRLGRTELARLAIDEFGVNVDKIELVNRWYIGQLQKGHSELFMLLMDRDADMLGSVSSIANAVVDLDDIPVLEAYLDNVTRRSRADLAEALEQAWSAASYMGLHESVRLLLRKYKVDPRSADNLALRWCCRHGYTDVLRVLLEFGLDLTALSGNMPMYLAMREQHYDTVSLLLQHGADVDVLSLHEAVRSGNTELAQKMIESASALTVALARDVNILTGNSTVKSR